MSEREEESFSTPIIGPSPQIEIVNGKIVFKNSKKKEIQPKPNIIPRGENKRLMCEECEVMHRQHWKKIQVIEYENGSSYVDESFCIGRLCIECNTKKNKKQKAILSVSM